MSGRSLSCVNFFLSIDLESFRIFAFPALPFHQGLVIAFSGYVAAASGSGPAADPALRVAAAYRRHGVGLSTDLLGQYAGAIVDLAARRVILLQDSLGLQPLFYVIEANRLSASTNLEWLAAARWPVELDEQYFAEFIVCGRNSVQRTPFRGIERLACGATLSISRRRVLAIRPWLPQRRPQRPPPEEAANHLRELLDEAVQSVLPPGDVLCELSGGLDSSSVFLTARKFRADAQAFSWLSSLDPIGDDEPYAREIATAANVTWHCLDADRYPPYSGRPDRFVAEPGSELDWAALSAYGDLIMRQKVDAVLTGLGGDILFGSESVAPFLLADPLSAGRPFAALKLAQMWHEYSGRSRALSHWLWHFGVRTTLRHWRRRRLATYSSQPPPPWLHPDFARFHASGLDRRPQDGPRVRLAGQQYLWELIYDTAGGIAAMRQALNGRQIRHPLLYRPLLEFMLNLDPTYKVSEHSTRLLQRQALVDRLPTALLARWTKGNPQRLYDRALARSKEWLRMVREDSRLVARGWVDERHWREEVDRARLSVVRVRSQLDATMMLECWLRTIETYSPQGSPILQEVVTSGFAGAPS